MFAIIACSCFGQQNRSSIAPPNVNNWKGFFTNDYITEMSCLS